MEPYVAGLLTANSTPFNVGSVGVSTMHVLKHLGTKKDASGRITLPRDTKLPSEAQVRALKEQALARLGHALPPAADDVASSDSVIPGKAPKSHAAAAGAPAPAAAAANEGRSPEPRRASQETPASPRSASFDGTRPPPPSAPPPRVACTCVCTVTAARRKRP